MNNIFQVNGLKMVDEPMEEGEADSCQVSTHIIKLHFSNMRAKNSMKGDSLMSIKEMYLGKLISKSNT